MENLDEIHNSESPVKDFIFGHKIIVAVLSLLLVGTILYFSVFSTEKNSWSSPDEYYPTTSGETKQEILETLSSQSLNGKDAASTTNVVTKKYDSKEIIKKSTLVNPVPTLPASTSTYITVNNDTTYNDISSAGSKASLLESMNSSNYYPTTSSEEKERILSGQ